MIRRGWNASLASMTTVPMEASNPTAPTLIEADTLIVAFLFDSS